MNMRFLLWVVLLPGLIGIAAMAAVLLPGANDLSLPRVLAGGAAMMAVQVAGGWIGGYQLGRRGLLR
ncbi:hypothetical protein OHS33_39520 (plasmid) [Streptomyces sp. NBC_00536]|uniref:hypothetical protein n=1 Tax=Streptomyces sp. NBC_00536 TaxID=2975769 RepID=UPI002E8053BA|nr:hypothetical protein [Streptomyces sp. NBC_00536]WUC84457.1 hypothetical protein OHS33_39520 [Streptomyces sp. NBC_00536]